MAVSGVALLMLTWINVSAQETEPEVLEQIVIVDDPSATAEFGASVGIDSLFAISGSPGDDSFGINAGSAYFMIDYLGTWVQRQKLSPPDAQSGDEFGHSVSLDSVFFAVGSPGSNANKGATYIYVEESIALQPGPRFAPEDLLPGDRFGESVSISDGLVAVGALGHDAAAEDAGAVYLFRHNGSSWGQEAKLVAPDAARGDLFGISVAVDNDLLVVGASRDDSTGTDSGSLYVYRHDGTTWQFEKKLVADHGNQYDLLGTSVDVSGNVVIGGSFGDDSRGLNSGSATIWSFDGLDWVQDVVLFADDPGPDDHFGRTVAISDTLAVVGSHWKTVGTRFALGAAYVYRNELADWFFEHKLVASDREELDLFGEAVAVYGHTVLVGAIRTDLEGATDAGSTYFYDIPRPFIPPEPVAVEESFHTGPESLRLDGVYPNPFRDRISIELHLESPSALSVTVYNMAGQEVAVVADTFLGSGRALLSWSPAPHLASGMYLVRVNTGSRVVTSKVALIK